jgi:hypothetical protein
LCASTDAEAGAYPISEKKEESSATKVGALSDY